MADNSLHNRGYGKWLITIYAPQKEIGPYIGDLYITKDSYYVCESDPGEEEVILVTVPSQNVSYCENII